MRVMIECEYTTKAFSFSIKSPFPVRFFTRSGGVVITLDVHGSNQLPRLYSDKSHTVPHEFKTIHRFKDDEIEKWQVYETDETLIVFERGKPVEICGLRITKVTQVFNDR